ncbi:MAG: hypothetical protein AAFY59_13875 [Pseudomonadota bacterium]
MKLDSPILNSVAALLRIGLAGASGPSGVAVGILLGLIGLILYIRWSG